MSSVITFRKRWCLRDTGIAGNCGGYSYAANMLPECLLKARNREREILGKTAELVEAEREPDGIEENYRHWRLQYEDTN